MKDEIKRIMRLVQEGKLSPEDAAELIEAFSDAPSEPEAEEPAPKEKAGEPEAGEPKTDEKSTEGSSTDPFSRFIGSVERITKDVATSVDWKDIARQIRTGVNKGAEAIKTAVDEASKGKNPWGSVFGSQVKRHFELPLDIPTGRIFRLEGVTANVTVEGGHDIGSITIDASFRAFNEEEAKAIADRYMPVLEESETFVAFRNSENDNLQADITVKLPAGTPVEVRVTSGDIRVSRTSSSVRASSTSGDVHLSDLDGTAEVTVSSGNVTIADAKASVMTVESKSGDMLLTNVSGVINVRTSSGDIRAIRCPARTFSAEAASGDISLDISQPVEGAINIRTVSGDVSLEIPDGSDARVSLSTLRGAVATTLALTDEVIEGLTITGRLGEGSGSIDVSAVNGSVSLGLRDVSQD